MVAGLALQYVVDLARGDLEELASHLLDALRYAYVKLKSIARTEPVKRREQYIPTISFGDWM